MTKPESHGQAPAGAAVREACSKIIHTLAAIVNLPQTDEQVSAELVPRNPLMQRVQEIKTQVDAIYKEFPVAQPTPTEQAAPAAGAVAGPKKWTLEELADGRKGIRWVTDEGVFGRPTDHDVREYLQRTPIVNGCHCEECKRFYTAAPTPAAQADSGVQEDAARYQWWREFFDSGESLPRALQEVRNSAELDAAIDAARAQQKEGL